MWHRIPLTDSCEHGNEHTRPMMEAVLTSETSVYFNETTRLYIPEVCHIHTRSSDNPKSHTTMKLLVP
jgi:hypothetical protein